MNIRFESEKITDHIIRIKDGTDVCEYLVQGDNKAILIDTGYGIGDLKGFIESICDKPLDVYITHGHVDHASGTAPFERVHMHLSDMQLQRVHGSVEFRKQILKGHGSVYPDDLYLPLKESGYIDIADKELIDLGNVHVMFIHVPGHTKGSIVPLILEDRAVIFGDACGVGTLICLDGSTSISTYLESLKNLKTYESLYDLILRQHGTCISEKAVLDNNIENCKLIIAGKDDRVEDTIMGRKVFWARRKDPSGGRTDGKEGNIAYIAENI